MGSVGFPNVNVGLGVSFGGFGLLKPKPTEGAGLSASLAALNRNPVEAVEVSFFPSGLPNIKVVVEVFCGVSTANNSAVVGSATGGLPKTGAALAEAPSVEGVSSFSALALGADKLNDGLDPDFSSGFKSPNAKLPDAVVGAALVELEPKGIASLPPNLKPAPEFWDSLFFPSLVDSEVEAAPNLKLPEEPPVLKALAELEPVEVCSVEAPPNLNDPEELSEDEPPNLKPPEDAVESDEALPNLKDTVEVESAKVPPNFNSQEVEFEGLEVPNLKAVELELVLDDCVPKPETQKHS